MQDQTLRLGAYAVLSWLGLFLIVLIVAMATSCQTAGQLRGNRTLQEEHAQVVIIRGICLKTDGTEMIMFGGSGVLISPTLLLTAGHVAANRPGYSCIYNGTDAYKNEHMLMPSVVDVKRDVASMRVVMGEFPYGKPVEIGEAPELGATICEVSAVPYHVRRCGEVQPSSGTSIDSTMLAEAGNSGSGVYNTLGQLVGIISMSWACGNGQYCGSVTASIDEAELEYLRTGFRE